MSNFRKVNKKEYKDLYKKALFKTFFHNPDWFDFLEKEFKWLKFEHYLYKDKALLSFGKVGNKLISLPFCEYGGPLPLKKKTNFEQFKKDVIEEFGSNIKIKVHPQIIFMWEAKPPTGGLASSNVSTYWMENLDKKSEQELLSSFRKTLRHSIRNAQKEDLEIKKCSKESELKQFYNLYVANLRKKRTVPYPFSIFKFLYNRSETEISLALYKRRIIAGDLFLHYDKFLHYFLSASDYKHRNLGASYLILWQKIKSLCGKDVILDLGAAPKGSALETFKRGWRGKEYPILQIGIKRSEETLRSSKLRNIWRLLPSWLIKILSPKLIKYRL